MCGAFASVPTKLQYEQFRGGRYLSIAGFKKSDCKCLTIYRDSIPPLAYEARVEAEPFCMYRNHSRFQDLEGQDGRTSDRQINPRVIHQDALYSAVSTECSSLCPLLLYTVVLFDDKYNSASLSVGSFGVGKNFVPHPCIWPSPAPNPLPAQVFP